MTGTSRAGVVAANPCSSNPDMLLGHPVIRQHGSTGSPPPAMRASSQHTKGMFRKVLP